MLDRYTMNRRVVKERRTVRCARGYHVPGGSPCYGYSYVELATMLGVEPAAVLTAVAGGQLDPLSLAHLALAKRHGLDAVIYPSRRAGRVLAETRVDPIDVYKTVRVPTAGRPLAVDTVWAFSVQDLVTATGLTRREITDQARRGSFDFRSIASVVRWVGARLPPEIRAALRLDPAEGTAA